MTLKRGKKWVARPKVNGRHEWLGTFETKREARRVEDKYLSRFSESDETCDSFALAWVARYPRRKESTNIHNHERIQKFAKDFRGVLLGDVSRKRARSWALENKSCVSSVRAMFTDAMNDGLVAFNPFGQLKLERSKGRLNIEVVTKEELARLIEVAQESHGVVGEQLGAMVTIAAFVGCRPGELFALSLDDITGSDVRISLQVSSKARKMTTPKNGKARQVIFPPQAQEALRGVQVHEGRPMFRTPRGRAWTLSNWAPYWRTIKVAAGLKDMDFYELRHFCATYLRSCGASFEDIAFQLGHTDRGLLARSLYAHPNENASRGRLLSAYTNGPAGVADSGERPNLRVALG